MDIIPSERQKPPKAKFAVGDRVSTPATTWFGPEDAEFKKHPVYHGTVMMASEFSVRVFWDLDQTTSDVSRNKITLLPKDSAYQATSEDERSGRNKSQFQRPGRKRKAAAAARMQYDSDDNLDHLDLSNSDTEAQTEKRPRVIKSKNNLPPKQTQRPNGPANALLRTVTDQAAAGPSKQVKPASNKRKRKTLMTLKEKKSARTEPEATPTISSDISDSETDDDTPEPVIAPTSREINLDDPFKFKIAPVVFDYSAENGHRAVKYGARLNGLVDNKTATPIDHFLLFLPREYIESVVISKANVTGRDKWGREWKDVSFGEFLTFFGIMIYMETVALPERRDYWGTETVGPYTAQNLGRYMSRGRYERLLHCLCVFLDKDAIEDKDLQRYWDSMDGLTDALCKKFQEALTPGRDLTLDESMIKSYHQDLPGKIKIRRKPRPVGNEVYDLCDAETLIVLVLEFNKGKHINPDKEFVKELGATTACSLRLTKPYWGSGRVVYLDSWFGSIKTCSELLDRGLYCVGVVKTAHKLYPKELLAGEKLEKGEWVSASPTADGAAKIWCCRYMDRKPFQFVSSCWTSLNGEARIDSRGAPVNRPMVASAYFGCAGAIDRYNHCRTGSVGLEDAVRTKDPSMRQMCGLLGFVETNAYRSFVHFTGETKHKDFKKLLVQQLLSNNFDAVSPSPARKTRSQQVEAEELLHGSHKLKQYPGVRSQKRCHYCYHGYDFKAEYRSCYYCSYCGDEYAICPPNSDRDCWTLHIKNGMPLKKRRVI